MVAEGTRVATAGGIVRAMDPRLVQAVTLLGLAYLVGSIPMGVLVARLTGGVDPRTVGSGRTGRTNALRAMGPTWSKRRCTGTTSATLTRP